MVLCRRRHNPLPLSLAAAPIAPSAPASAAPAPSYVYAYASGACTQALPGGYTVSEKVFYTGLNHTFPNGDKLVHGQQGEVVGPATLETHKGKGVNVRFPGNTASIGCFLNTVRRFRAASAATRPYVPHTRRCVRTSRAAVPTSTRPQLQASAAAVAPERGHAGPHPSVFW